MGIKIYFAIQDKCNQNKASCIANNIVFSKGETTKGVENLNEDDSIANIVILKADLPKLKHLYSFRTKILQFQCISYLSVFDSVQMTYMFQHRTAFTTTYRTEMISIVKIVIHNWFGRLLFWRRLEKTIKTLAIDLLILKINAEANGNKKSNLKLLSQYYVIRL